MTSNSKTRVQILFRMSALRDLKFRTYCQTDKLTHVNKQTDSLVATLSLLLSVRKEINLDKKLNGAQSF